MHSQLGLQIPTEIDRWTPPQNGRAPIEWIRMPFEATKRCFRIPLWISQSALERCLHGTAEHHRARNALEEEARYNQIIVGIHLFGKFAFGPNALGNGAESEERVCLWTPGWPHGEFNDKRHEYQVALSVTLKQVFNRDQVLLLTLWEELHDSVPVRYAPRASRYA